MHYEAIALLAAAAATKVAGAPEPKPSNVLGPFFPDGFVPAAGGALDPSVTPPPSLGGGDVHAERAKTMTVTFANHDYYKLHLAHVRGADSPPPIGFGNDGAPDAHLEVGGHQVLKFPAGYNGATYMNIETPGHHITGQDESLIENSFVDQGNGEAAGDIDVSYVNGFSRAATCVCRDGRKLAAGCSKNLWTMGNCPDNNNAGSCRNPKRYDNGATSPTAFFAPCDFHGGAFTYPQADANTLNYKCPSENYYCCIGNDDYCRKFNNNPRD